MSKILFLVSTLKQSGTTIQLYYIAKYMKPGKYDLYALTLSPEEEGSMLKRFSDVGVIVQSLNLSRVGGIIKGKSKLLKVIRQIEPDLIHTQGFRSDAYSMVLADKYPIVSSMQTYPFYDYPLYYGKIMGRLMALRHLAIIKKRENFIACSKSVAKKFSEINMIHMDSIQNGVDIDVFNPIAYEEKNKLREKLNLPKNKKIFISVGVLIPRKDMETVIQGFQKSNNGDAMLLIAGGGNLYNNLISLSGGDNSIRLLGDIRNVSEQMQASDYFISASLAEGLPNTVLEAMACSLPVILSDIEPHKEVFEQELHYPYFFETRDAKKLSILIKDILRKNYSDLQAMMLRIIRQNFTAQIMSEKYQRLYNNLIS